MRGSSREDCEKKNALAPPFVYRYHRPRGLLGLQNPNHSEKMFTKAAENQGHSHDFLYSTIFWTAILLHACFWTFAPPYFIPNYRIDTSEMMVIGQHWVLSTFKHPAFQGWVVEILSQIFLRAELVPYLAAQIATVLSVWGIWKLAQKFLSPQLALVATLAMLSYIYFNFESTLYNNRTFMRSFWILAVYCLYCATESGKNRYWVLTGIMLGLGLACNLTTFLLILTILIYMFAEPHARKFWKTSGPYLSTSVCLLMFLPFLLWFAKLQFSVLNYAHDRLSVASPTLFDHCYAPVYFGLTQLFAIGPILIPLLPFLKFRWKFDWSRIGGSPASRFLTLFIFLPFVLQMLVAAYLGGTMRTALGCQLWVFLPIFLLYAARFDAKNCQSFHRSIVLALFNIFLFAGIGVLIFTLGPCINGKGSREHFPGKDLAAAVETIWEDRFHTPLPYVRGDDWLAQNVAVYASSRPEVFSPLWSTAEDFIEKGGILLWMEGGAGRAGSYGTQDFHFSSETGYPDEWLKQFSNAEVLPLILLPKKTRFDVPAVKISIAIVPPAAMPTENMKK